MESLCIYFTGKDKVELLKESVPPLKAGQLLVRSSKSLISTGTECICLGRLFEEGTHWDRWVRYPFPAGYSTMGIVEQVGEGVDQFKPGDRVVFQRSHRQWHVVDAKDATLVQHEEVSDEEAAWFALAMIAQNAVRMAQHQMGDNVVVIGAGLLGQLTVQYLRLQGAGQIIVIDPAEPRLQMAREHGATTVIAKTAQEAREEVLQLTEGKGAEVVYDITGIASVFATALTMLRRFGKLVLLGDTGEPSQQFLTGDVVTKGLRIIGTHASNPPEVSTDHAIWTQSKMYQLFFTYLARGDMRVKDLITHRVSPYDAPQVYHMLRYDRSAAMGVVFDWTQV
ncbi:MAG: zinc-binding alcohol dehydrogenase [bacterium]|nr:zinc-binding alcohol dehydrogenase [bacterium]